MRRLAVLPLACQLLAAYLLAVVCLPSLAPLCRSGERAACALPAAGAVKRCCCKLMNHGETAHACPLHARHGRCSLGSRPIEGQTTTTPAIAFDARGIAPRITRLLAPRVGDPRSALPPPPYQPPDMEIPTPPPRLAA